jgi:membrane-bound lytic murein transglycosylase D
VYAPIVGRFSQKLAALCFCALILCGCGSTKAVVKKDPQPASGVSTLFASLFDGPELKPDKPIKITGEETFPPIPLDTDGPRVRRFIRHYSKDDRMTIESYMAKAQKYMPMVKSVAKEHGLPEDIAYLFLLESGANPQARSGSNALGMWQFMPATARSYGLKVDSWVDERLDPNKSTRAAMMYLKDLYGMFGCWKLALSAYNSGENKMNRVLCQEDADKYEQVCSSRKLKRETREFWPRFRAIAHIAKNPHKFGFRPMGQAIQEPETSIVKLKGGYSIERLAKASGIPKGLLSDLNPSLLRGVTPPGDEPYELVAPRVAARILESRLAAIPRINTSRHIVHVVNRGDSVWGITRKYRITKDQLAGLNPDINLSKTLRAGVKLVVPAKIPETTDQKAQTEPQRISMVR